jgi:Gpi18-like mannosyltransferase
MALLKLPAIVADIGIAVTLIFAGRKWFSPATALVAAAAYLFIPVTWYDSAIWGQVDSLSALPMLLAVVFVIDRKPEWSALALTVAVLMKPQGALVLLVLLPVLIGQVVHKELRWWRMLTTVGAGIVSFAIIATPWSLEKYAPEGVAGIPVIGDFAGLVGQYVSTLGWFPVVTANAFNPWALAGRNSIASTIQNGYVFWMPDGYRLLGLPAALIGNGLFLLLVGALFWLLIKRHSATQVLTAYALLLVGFYILPTRVHERYLVQAFAVLAIIWAPQLIDRFVVVLLAVANTVNLHAILVADLNVQTIDLVSANSAAKGGQAYSSVFAPIIHLTDPASYGLGWVRMDASFARAEPVVIAVILIQLAAFGYLAWQYLQLNRAKNAG